MLKKVIFFKGVCETFNIIQEYQQINHFLSFSFSNIFDKLLTCLLTSWFQSFYKFCMDIVCCPTFPPLQVPTLMILNYYQTFNIWKQNVILTSFPSDLPSKINTIISTNCSWSRG